MAYDPRYYTHDSDKAALKALKSIPGFSKILKLYMNVWGEKQDHIMHMSSNLRINERQLKKYYNMLPPICEKLGIAIPDIYLESDPFPNAYTWGDTNPYIVITSGLIESTPEDLIPTVIAHECGHIACKHSLYTQMGSLILREASNFLYNKVPYGDLITIPLQVAFYYWMRCSEFSADRAAILCDGNAENVARMCMFFAGYDRQIPDEPDLEAFLDQARAYRTQMEDSKWDKTIEFYLFHRYTHPLTAVRALSAVEWVESLQYQQIMDGTFFLPEDVVIEDEQGEDLRKKKKIKLPKLKRESKKTVIATNNEIVDLEEVSSEGFVNMDSDQVEYSYMISDAKADKKNDYFKYWQGFFSYCADHGREDIILGRKVPKDGRFIASSGIKEFVYIVTIPYKKNLNIGVHAYGHADEFERLLEKKEKVEEILGQPLDWDSNKAESIEKDVFLRTGEKPEFNRKKSEAQYALIVKTIDLFRKALRQAGWDVNE